MAKEIPYFKFYVGEWSNGDITAESYELQGVFINLCAVYWTKEGALNYKFACKKFGKENIDELIEAEIIGIQSDKIEVSFLNEQLKECEGIRKQASNAGKASAAARAKKRAEQKFNDRSTTVQQNFNGKPTEGQPIREEKRREEEIREENKKINIIKRENLFRLQSKKFETEYGSDLIEAFCDYWTEPNKSKTKMKFELQKTFDLSRRLKTWNRNNFNNGNSKTQQPTEKLSRFQKFQRAHDSLKNNG